MPRPWTLAPVLFLALLAAPLSTARAAKPVPPPPAPTITAIALGSLDPAQPAMFAAASDGRIFVAVCGAWNYVSVQPFQDAAQLPGKPISLTWVSDGYDVLVGLENGDIYRADAILPLAFSLVRNVFTSTGARVPAFPDLGALEDARAPLEPEPDAPGMVK